MPQLTPIVLNDDLATAHTFNPVSVNERGLSVLIENSQSQRQLAEKLTLSQVPVKGNNGFRTEARITVPKVSLDANTGLSSVVETDTVVISFTNRPNSTSASRKTLRSLALAALADGGTLATMIDNTENVW